MSHEFEDDLSGKARPALAALPREKTPPPSLEDRVVERLKREKLVRPSGRVCWASLPRLGLAAAASVLFFILGAAAGVTWVSTPAQKKAPTEFILMLRAGPEQSRPGSPDEGLRRAKEYGNWARQLRQQGVTVAGEKLKEEARVIPAAGGSTAAPARPPVNDRGAIAGYFLLGARDYEQAVKIAEGCPHLRYGGSIEVRQIDRF